MVTMLTLYWSPSHGGYVMMLLRLGMVTTMITIKELKENEQDSAVDYMNIWIYIDDW